MKKTVSKYRGELKSVIPPTLNICCWMGIIFFAAILFKNKFVIDMKMLEAILILETVLIPFVALIIGVCTLFYKITVYSDGVSSYDPGGNFKCDFMQYSEMEDIKIKNVFGYKYYFIHSVDNSKTLWVPFNVKNKDRFKETLESIVGSKHIIIEGLATLKV